MYNPQGELATARAAKSKKHLQMLSTMTTTPVEEVNAARGEPVWFQLYSRPEWGQTRELVKRVEAAGCPALVFTVDLLGGRNTPTMTRFARLDTRNCGSCHSTAADASRGASGAAAGVLPIMRPMYDGLDGRYNPPDATWATFDRLKKLTRMKVMLKGLDSAEDAQLAVQHGADGILVSNHGGRSTETLRPTIECLPEVVEAVRGRIPVFLDGGVRHGADIYKALAYGARGVGIGRGEGVQRQPQHLARQPAHLRQIEMRLQLRFVIQVDRRARDVAGMVGNALQNRRDLDGGDDQPQPVRLVQRRGQQPHAELIGLQFQRVHAVVVAQDLLGQLGIALDQRARRLVNRPLDLPAHQQDVVAQIVQGCFRQVLHNFF